MAAGSTECSKKHNSSRRGLKLKRRRRPRRREQQLDLRHTSRTDQRSCGGTTALFAAVGYKHPAVIRMLLDRGADRTIRSNGGQIAAELAAENLEHATKYDDRVELATECADLLK